jgi:hypothetical protein
MIRQRQALSHSYPEIFGSHTQSSHGCEVLDSLVQSSQNICNTEGSDLRLMTCFLVTSPLLVIGPSKIEENS